MRSRINRSALQLNCRSSLGERCLLPNLPDQPFLPTLAARLTNPACLPQRHSQRRLVVGGWRLAVGGWRIEAGEPCRGRLLFMQAQPATQQPVSTGSQGPTALNHDRSGPRTLSIHPGIQLRLALLILSFPCQ